jgi:acyl-CoA synthetase (AMP-forming)/AMP-acid ligase II
VLDTVPGVRPGSAAALSHRSEDAEAERLVVFVEARTPGPDLADRCRQAILAATGLDAARVVLLLPGRLPRTSSGKVRRAETLRRWLGGTLVDSPDGVGMRPEY